MTRNTTNLLRSMRTWDLSPRTCMLLSLILLFQLISPGSTTIQSVTVEPIGALMWYISWVEQVDVTQTYTLLIRDITSMKSYIKYNLRASPLFFILNSTSASEFSAGGFTFAGLSATHQYGVQVCVQPRLLQYVICGDICI